MNTNLSLADLYNPADYAPIYQFIEHVLHQQTKVNCWLLSSNYAIAQIFSMQLTYLLLAGPPYKFTQFAQNIRLATEIFALLEMPDLKIMHGAGVQMEVIGDIVKFVNSSAMQTVNKVLLILEPEQLSAAIFNALLKSLEEAKQDCHIILASNHLGGVADTIKSRCFHIAIPQSSAEYLAKLVKLHLGETAYTTQTYQQALILSKHNLAILGELLQTPALENYLAAIEHFTQVVQTANLQHPLKLSDLPQPITPTSFAYLSQRLCTLWLLPTHELLPSEQLLGELLFKKLPLRERLFISNALSTKIRAILTATINQNQAQIWLQIISLIATELLEETRLYNKISSDK